MESTLILEILDDIGILAASPQGIEVAGALRLPEAGPRSWRTNLWREFVFEDAVQALMLGDNPSQPVRKPYRFVEAYLWTPTIQASLRKLGFLEGNFLVLVPLVSKSNRPHVDDPLHTIRLPHLGETELINLPVLCVRRDMLRGAAEYVDALREKDPIKTFRQSDLVFPHVPNPERIRLFDAIAKLCAARGTVDHGTNEPSLFPILEEIESVKAGAYLEHVRQTLGSTQSVCDIDAAWKAYVETRLRDEILYQITVGAVAQSRDPLLPWGQRLEFVRFLEKRHVDTLRVEDAEISLLLLVDRIRSSEILGVGVLKELGLIDVTSECCSVTERSRRVLSWLARRFAEDSESAQVGALLPLDGIGMASADIRAADLRTVVASLLKDATWTEADVVQQFDRLRRVMFGSRCWVNGLEGATEILPINPAIHRILRRGETVCRDIFCFPVTPLPTEGLDPASAVVFVGTFTPIPPSLGKDMNAPESESADQLRDLRLLFRVLGYINLDASLQQDAQDYFKQAKERLSGLYLSQLAHQLRRPLEAAQAHLTAFLEGDMTFHDESRVVLVNRVCTVNLKWYDLAEAALFPRPGRAEVYSLQPKALVDDIVTDQLLPNLSVIMENVPNSTHKNKVAKAERLSDYRPVMRGLPEDWNMHIDAPHTLGLILYSLIENAYIHSDLASPEIGIEVVRQASHLVIDVSNNGVPMADSIVRFVNEADEHDAVSIGTRRILGLRLTKRLIESQANWRLSATVLGRQTHLTVSVAL